MYLIKIECSFVFFYVRKDKIMEFYHTVEEAEKLSRNIKPLLTQLFISTGIFTSIFIDCKHISSYNTYPDIVRTFVIDVLVPKDNDGQIVKPVLNAYDFKTYRSLFAHDLYSYRFKTKNLNKTEWRMVCLVYKDGTVECVSPEAKSYEETTQILKIIEQNFIHPSRKTIEKNDVLKPELLQYVWAKDCKKLENNSSCDLFCI